LKDVGLDTPESTYYDAEQDCYFVSNIVGKPFDVDGNGFISKVSADGKLVELKWADKSKKGTTLNAPKGITASGNVVYVADITFVRTFDRKTGAPLGKIAAPGATFLNDITTGPDGTVYVTDSGLKPGKDGFEPSGTDAVYKIAKGNRISKLAASKDFGGPNGIVADETGVWFVTFATSSLVHVGLDGKAGTPQKLPGGQFDGLIKLPDGSLMVSSWQTSTVYRGMPGGTFEPAIKDVKSPADIGYDSKRNVVSIPIFTGNAVELHKLAGGPILPPNPAVPPAPPPPPAPPGAAAPPHPHGAPPPPPPGAPMAPMAPGAAPPPPPPAAPPPPPVAPKPAMAPAPTAPHAASPTPPAAPAAPTATASGTSRVSFPPPAAPAPKP
jgi:sugar lactone lactonase YvrE